MTYKDLRKQIEALNNLKKQCPDPVAADLIEEAILTLEQAQIQLTNG
ncbi:hypothetical protein H6F44_20030 [Pseudanabaena sp. FACHB-1277]|uniref:Uncharacterized protein n=1 Tax=Pseudanabaena cinerea FACHB-1277 TaxID=2949581 RepID=A0A926UW97_9CYAN|nr:hypothetical protein [Pseudanabaena cinerea]MBD2152387.1 hypothetical protein [Pseudanabaena cinerea FACHB-1277]